MGFSTSLVYGRSGEKLVLSLLNKNGFSATLNDVKENNSYYDIIVQLSPRKKVYVETKFDMMYSQTGNMCLEYHNPKLDKPSGINITKAHIWSVMLMDEGNPTVWFASVPKLKDFLQQVKPFKTIAVGGDKNASLYLYRADVILPAVFHQMNALANPEDFQKIVKTLIAK